MMVVQSIQETILIDSIPKDDCMGSSLNDLIGGWTTDEADAVDSTLADFANIDEDDWE